LGSGLNVEIRTSEGKFKPQLKQACLDLSEILVFK